MGLVILTTCVSKLTCYLKVVRISMTPSVRACPRVCERAHVRVFVFRGVRVRVCVHACVRSYQSCCTYIDPLLL